MHICGLHRLRRCFSSLRRLLSVTKVQIFDVFFTIFGVNFCAFFANFFHDFWFALDFSRTFGAFLVIFHHKIAVCLVSCGHGVPKVHFFR